MKRKIGTQVEKKLFHEVKILSARQRKPIGEIVEAALSDYLNRNKQKAGRRSGLLRFIGGPAFKLTDKQLRGTMEADFYDQ